MFRESQPQIPILQQPMGAESTGVMLGRECLEVMLGSFEIRKNFVRIRIGKRARFDRGGEMIN